MMHDIISRREFVAPCTDREALRLKLLRVLTEPPAKVDIIDQHVACLGSVVSYSSFYLEGSISHYPDQIIVHLFLVTVDARVARSSKYRAEHCQKGVRAFLGDVHLAIHSGGSTCAASFG
jgi:hypothetical protein